MDAQVDASRPFRSVKEAVAIFGNRLFFGEIESSPKRPSLVVKTETKHASDVTQSPETPSNPSAEQDNGSTFDEAVDSTDHTLHPSERVVESPMNEVPPEIALHPSERVVESPMYEVPPEIALHPSERVVESPTYEVPPEITLHPSERVVESPMSEVPPESTLHTNDQVVESPMYKVPPTSPLNGQNDGSPLDEPSYSTIITLGPTEPLRITCEKVDKSAKCQSSPITETPKKDNRENIVHGNDLVMMMMVLKKLEVELQETKTELKLLKERGSETEVALASLNAELHKSMSKIAKAEAAEAAKEATKSITNPSEGRHRDRNMRDDGTARREATMKTIDSPTLAQILKISDYERYFEENKLKARKLMKKKKPIVPLVTDLFLWKKKASPSPGVSDQIFSKMYFT